MINGIHSGDLEARLFVGMGGSGMKTLVEFVRLLTQHSEAAKQSEVFMAYLLVDTDMGELAECKKQIEDAYRHVHREPILAAVHLSADITDFPAFVSNKLHRGAHHERLKEVWWYRGSNPFTAINLKDSPTRGAGQCPLVSTFLAWNQMRQIETTIDELLDMLKNRSVQGENLQNWTLNVSIVAGLAGGTGRGCWHLVASKIREKLRDLNIRPKPTGFFFDSSVFAETVKREEQVTKLQVNSLTGVSELVAWLRNEYEREGALEPYQFRLPSLNDPAVESSDLINTVKLSQSVTGDVLYGVSGRAPVSAAYLIFGAGKQGTLGKVDAYYRSVATALYARLAASIASKNINEAGHLNGMAAATISVSIAGVLEYIREYVREFLPREFSAPQSREETDAIVAAVLKDVFDVNGVLEQRGDEQAANVPQRVYQLIADDTNPIKSALEKNLTRRAYRDAESNARNLSDWAENNESEIQKMVRQVVVSHYWGEQIDESGTLSGGAWGTRLLCESVDLTDQEREGLFADGEETVRRNPVSLFVRKLLWSNVLRIRDADSTTDYNISSYGTKLAIAEGIIDSLQDILGKRINDAIPPEPVQGESPLAKLQQARTGFFASGVTDAESDAILRSVEPWVLGSSNRAIREALKSILAGAVDELKRYALAVSRVTNRLGQVAAEMHESTRRLRENFFWGKHDFDLILEEGQSAFDQEMLSTQTLKAVGEDKDLVDEFRRVMREAAPAGFTEMQGKFFDLLGQWIDGKAASSDPGLDRRLPDIVAETLRDMADQFVLSDQFVERNFGFFVTVKRLLREWGNKMVERQGSPQDRAKLASVFRNQFGIEYRKSNMLKGEADSPKVLEDAELHDFTKEVCKSMAVRLGGRCDPLFQQRFDEGERPTYDSVLVVFPAEEQFDKQFAKGVDELAGQNPQFMGAGNFQAVVTFGNLDTGNPYTMFAYATQQFEDWRRDAGMARIASLEYYKTPTVLNWLRACEDPHGASVFVDGKELQRFGIHSHRDIYGLGYISPLFVRNETLRELRWSPWDESKKRSANKRNERIDLLAYALLAPPQNAPEGSPAAAARHFNEVVHRAGWRMPLLAWQDSPGSDTAPNPGSDTAPKWYYVRQAFRKTTEVTATESREENHPAFKSGHGHPSIRRCLDELLENHAIAQAIAGEAEMFMSEVLCRSDFEDEFRPEDDIKVTFGHLRDRLETAKTKQAGPAAEKMVKLIEELLARVKELRNLTPEQLKEHYEGIRRNTELYSRA